MKEFRKNVAISIDGGGIKGIVATKALSMLEDHLIQTGYIKKRLNEKVHLFAGTSTGAIIASALASGVSANDLNGYYRKLGRDVFKKLFPGYTSLRMVFTGEYYSNKKLESLLKTILGEKIGEGAKMKYFYSLDPKIDVVFTTFDITSNRTRFIKPWNVPEKKKDENFTEWPVVKAVLASSAAPTYFPPVKGEYGQYIDGGVGSYNNPSYITAYEITHHLNEKRKWTTKNTTLISIGTGRDKPIAESLEDIRLDPVKFAKAMLGAFMQSANDQQNDLTKEFLHPLDFRRFQVDLDEEIELDDVKMLKKLEEHYGKKMGELILDYDGKSEADKDKSKKRDVGKKKRSKGTRKPRNA